jgi:hypothetical protein
MIDHIKARRDIFIMIARRTHNNPIFSHDIEISLGLAGPAVRDIVRELRRAGEPIVASDKGYYFASTAEEVDKIVADLQQRIESMGKTVAAIKRTGYERIGRQARFSFSEGRGSVQGAPQGDAAPIHSDSEEEVGGKSLLPLRMANKEDTLGYIPGICEAFSLDSLLQPAIGK